jgi:hypothetical protein
MNMGRPLIQQAWPGTRCSSNFFEDIGDPTVSPSYGDGKNSGPHSTNVA